jgi:hypothetical protein
LPAENKPTAVRHESSAGIAIFAGGSTSPAQGTIFRMSSLRTLGCAAICAAKPDKTMRFKASSHRPQSSKTWKQVVASIVAAAAAGLQSAGA